MAIIYSADWAPEFEVRDIGTGRQVAARWQGSVSTSRIYVCDFSHMTLQEYISRFIIRKLTV